MPPVLDHDLKPTEVNERIVEAASALLAASHFGFMNIVVLNKALFYLDLVALRDFGNTLTGAVYVALPQGPVVNNYKARLIAGLESAGIAKQIDEPDFSKPLVLQKEAKYVHLDVAARRLAGPIAQGFEDVSSTQASRISHLNPGWVAAWSRGAGTHVNMSLALQQIIDVDPWLTAPADDEVEASLSAVGHATAEAW